MRMRSSVSRMVIVLSLVAAHAGAATVPSVFGGKVPSVNLSGVQFCAGTLLTRVETWDGVPLRRERDDSARGHGRALPLIVDLHGWGVSKSNQPFVQQAPAGVQLVSSSGACCETALDSVKRNTGMAFLARE